MVVAQLVERSLPLQEVCSSNPVIGKKYIEHLITVNCVEKTKMKKKRPGLALFKKILWYKTNILFFIFRSTKERDRNRTFVS